MQPWCELLRRFRNIFVDFIGDFQFHTSGGFIRCEFLGVGKAAQETLFAALAQEVAGTGVTVNVVRVRAIDTSAGPDGSAKAHDTSPAEISAAIR